MADRKIDSTELDQPLQTTQVLVNGRDVETLITNAYSSLGIPTGSVNMGAVNPTTVGGQSTAKKTVKELIDIIADFVEQTGTNLQTLQSAVDNYIDDTQTLSNKTWSSQKIQTELTDMVDDAQHGDVALGGDGAVHKTTETYNQAVIENILTAKFDAALSDIETAIANAI